MRSRGSQRPGGSGHASRPVSGGEPLLRPDVFEIATCSGARANCTFTRVACCSSATRTGWRNHLRVIIPLDSPDEEGYRAIRSVAALPAIERGVAKLRVMIGPCRCRHAPRFTS